MKDEKRACSRSNLQQHKSFAAVRKCDCNLGMHSKCCHDKKKASNLILVASSLLKTKESKGSKAVAITAYDGYYRWCMKKKEKVFPQKRHW